MADFKIARSTPIVSSDGVAAPARLNGRGELVVSPWQLSLLLEGKVFSGQVGSVTTPATFTSGVAANATPEFALRNPSGSGLVALPLHIQVYWEASAGAIQEAYAYSCQNDIGAGTSTAVTPVNMNTGNASGSGMTVAKTYTAGATTATNPIEFVRWGSPLDIDASTGLYTFKWNFFEDGNGPLISPNGSLAVVCGTVTTATGFIIVTWAEFKTSELV